MVKHYRIRQTQPKPIFTYILPLEIPLQNPLKGPLNFFFQKFKKISFLALLPYYKTTLVITIMKVITKNHYLLESLNCPSRENQKMAILVIFRPILTCLICLKGVFRQKTHFPTLGHPFLALKPSRELISTFLLCLGPLCTVV